MSDDPRELAQTRFEAFQNEFATDGRWWNKKTRHYETGRAILDESPEVRMQIAVCALDAFEDGLGDPNFTARRSLAFFGAKTLLADLLRRKLPFAEEDLVRVVGVLSRVPPELLSFLPMASIAGLLEKRVKNEGLTDRLRSAVEDVVARLQRDEARLASDVRKARSRLEGLVAQQEPGSPAITFRSGEPWTEQLQSSIGELGFDQQRQFQELLAHCATATQSKPSKKWLKTATALLEPIQDAFARVVPQVLGRLGEEGPPPTRSFGSYMTYHLHPTQVHDEHADLLRGLIWSTIAAPDDDVVQAVGTAAEKCYQKIPGVGPRAPKIGNACVAALSRMGDLSAIGQLSRLRTRVKHASTRKQLAKALATAAENAGISEDELEELAVPACGLTDVGELRRELGEFTAVVTVTDVSRKPQLTWEKADGKTQKSVPKAVKEHFPDELKAVKAAAKEVAQMLPAQRDRIEQAFLQERRWRFAEFRKRYLDHPLVGTLGRRMIWRFGDERRAGIWHEGRLVDVHGEPLEAPSDGTRVEPWHPLTEEAEDVLAWREWLAEHDVTQPFKQAHREIYVLTDAERRTGTYSNRFAAHVIRQHQFNALLQQRGWRYTLQGAFDSYNTPFLELPQWNLRAEFYVEPAGDSDAELSDMGIFLYLATDQVRFYEQGETEPMPLENVPPLVFSEVMRDVDLFVGVCSVGNNPEWQDGGPDGRYLDYWHSFSFGELGNTARTRREVLQRLVPRLKIADRCSFEDRFLVVRGDLRTYKIHLGSGNILMSPNDEYLCIVPQGRTDRAADSVSLPFEGDRTLSVILSKAFLLSDESKIKDETILSQIRR